MKEVDLALIQGRKAIKGEKQERSFVDITCCRCLRLYPSHLLNYKSSCRCERYQLSLHIDSTENAAAEHVSIKARQGIQHKPSTRTDPLPSARPFAQQAAARPSCQRLPSSPTRNTHQDECARRQGPHPPSTSVNKGSAAAPCQQQPRCPQHVCRCAATAASNCGHRNWANWAPQPLRCATLGTRRRRRPQRCFGVLA